MNSSDNRPMQAVALILLSIVFFDVMAILVRLLLDRYSAQELSAYRNVFGALPSIALLMWTRELKLNRDYLVIDRWKLAVMRGLIVALAQLCFYSSLAFLPLATVSALGQTQGIFVVLLSILVLGERVGLWRWGAVMIGFAGAMLILRPGTEAFQPAALLPIAASACYGLSMVTVRLFDKSVSNALLYLYSAMSSALGAIMLAAFTTEFHPVASLADAGLILLMSLIGGTAVLFLMLAYRLASPSMLAPFGYFGILTAFGFGYVVFGENPAQTLFPGVLLIVGAGIVILWRERPA